MSRSKRRKGKRLNAHIGLFPKVLIQISDLSNINFHFFAIYDNDSHVNVTGSNFVALKVRLVDQSTALASHSSWVRSLPSKHIIRDGVISGMSLLLPTPSVDFY